MGRDSQQQMLFTKKTLFIDGRIHGLIVNQQIQGTGEKLLGQFCGISFYQIDADMGILFTEAG